MLWRDERLARGHIAQKYKSQDLILYSSAASCWVSSVSMLEEGKDYVCPQRKCLWRLGGAPIFQLSRFLRISSLGRDLYGPWGPRGRSSREVATKDLTQNTRRDTAQYWRWLGTEPSVFEQGVLLLRSLHAGSLDSYPHPTRQFKGTWHKCELLKHIRLESSCLLLQWEPGPKKAN